MAFARIGIQIQWTGLGVDEKGIDEKSGRVLIEVDPRYFRPTEVDMLIGDPSKARDVLGWKHETDLSELVAEMVRDDLIVVAREKHRNAASGIERN